MGRADAAAAGERRAIIHPLDRAQRELNDEDQGKPSRVVVTDAWRKEQQAKRDAYEAKRRAWARTFERGGEAEEVDVTAFVGTSPVGAAETGGAIIPERRGRWGGTIQDRRQARFAF
jgi:hypothetical protein